MKITIVGSGNIGGLFGALLTDAGEDVTLVDIREDLIEAIQKDGIRIDTSSGESKRVQVKITNDIASIGVSDLVIIAVKSYSTRSAMESAMAVVGKDTHVLSVQNGAGNIETIAEVLGDESRIIGGIFLCVITPIGLNHLSWVVGTGGLKIGPVSGAMSPKIEEVAEVFSRAGIEVTTSVKVQDLIWNKLLLNSALCLATVLNITNDEFLAYHSTRQLVTIIANECIQVAKAKGINLDNPEDPIKPLLNTLETFRASGKKPKCSMLQDMERGRRTEINAINGSIVMEGKKCRIPTPINEAFVLLVRAMEEKSLNARDR
ncbi:2-dehydropantoate 2-reductase [subsurface metagenome]